MFSSVKRLNWDKLIDMMSYDLYMTIELLNFAPMNDSLIIEYYMAGSSHRCYIPSPHIKLLRKLYSLDHKELQRTIRFYVKNAQSIKELYKKDFDEDKYWDSITQDDKNWLMNMVLGSND